MPALALSFVGDTSALRRGIEALSHDLHFSVATGGLRVAVVEDSRAGVSVTRDASGATIRYAARIHFFRALGLLLENLGRERFEVREEPQFTTNGAMIDVSQGNAVLRPSTVERVLRRMAVMGLNMLMLYAEDSYTVPGEPEFGYMRSRYTHDEMRSLDDYAHSLGIELIPCMQTLAHLIDALKWQRFHDIRDDEDTLLVGDDRVYALIEGLIDAASSPVRTKRIHIGMDEAWKLGLGRYLQLNGYTPKFDIMNRHLRRVLEITSRRDLEPMIWSDMYFRAASTSGDYYDREAVIPDEVLRQAPTGVKLVYWDYYHTDQAFFEDFIDRHRRFGTDPVFAGGIWNWYSFGVNQAYTIASTNAALAACKRKGIKEVFATIWGDDANECIIDSTFPGMQLFAEHGYAREIDTAGVSRRFAACTGSRYDDFMETQLIDEIPGVSAGNPGMCNPSRYLLWQDPLLGMYDANTRGLGVSAHYARLTPLLQNAVSRNGDSGPVFEILSRLSAALEAKAEIGIRIGTAYSAGDRRGLSAIVEREFPELERRVRDLWEIHRRIWLAMYKPAGWEVFDVRYGGVLARIATASARLRAYLAGEISRVEELEEERHPFDGKSGPVRAASYARMVSSSRLSFTL